MISTTFIKATCIPILLITIDMKSYSTRGIGVVLVAKQNHFANVVFVAVCNDVLNELCVLKDVFVWLERFFFLLDQVWE